MEKKEYKPPSIEFIELGTADVIVTSTTTPPGDIPDYDDWFG